MELEQAKQELKMLETLYPNQHHYLKHELRSFIIQHSYSHTLPQYHTSLAFLDTEESTNLEQTKGIKLGLPDIEEVTEKKRKKGDESSELESPNCVVIKHYPCGKKNKRKDRVDLVLERAQNCLKKIRHFKTSLFSHS